MKKEDVILRGLIYNEEVSLAVADTTALVNEAIRIHGLSPLSAAALGRTLTVAAYMCSSLKTEGSALSVTIKGDGVGGPIYVSGDRLLHMRGYIDNPQAALPPNALGKLDVGGCVGRNGYLSVVRDDGENRPFVGTTPLVSGEIGEDFAAYFAYSEQLPTAIAVGVKISREGICLGAGGVFLQPLPGASEESIQKAEEAIGQFGAVSSLLQEMSAETLAEKYFGNVTFYKLKPEYKCNCSRNYIEGILAAMGEEELRSVVAEQGKISVHCHYCNTDYEFSPEEAEEIIKRSRA
ncbi:MAG TPA: Hsp33 family molecular chaperone HslO [Candidatus Borkfalkia avistercoris]|uniref:33 kDa chaperonin n=1 Tax=Candidatus Borkfalkia avistercoris TaxID=2838504 RepID=A0A9D2ID02_9FIRM|nr:Hsp33 family molecular chaperone HslO [Candidatus Borkfalkia avistercoris]